MVKADALYYQGSFEHALVNYFKALAHNRSKVGIRNCLISMYCIRFGLAILMFKFVRPIRIEAPWWKK